jgi:hypothetical protein
VRESERQRVCERAIYRERTKENDLRRPKLACPRKNIPFDTNMGLQPTGPGECVSMATSWYAFTRPIEDTLQPVFAEFLLRWSGPLGPGV